MIVMKNGRYEEYERVVHYKDDVLHREDGPAVETAKGDKYWYVNGVPHRHDGPAIELSNGYKEWIVNGKLHRLNGPARIWADGSETWFVDGQEVDITAIFGYLPSLPLNTEEQMVLRLSV